MTLDIKAFYNESIEEFGNYYNEYEKALIELIEYFTENNKHIIVWGLGKKAISFLNFIDVNHKYIDFVVDGDEKKQGLVLPTGHEVKSIDSIAKNDIIFIIQDIYLSVQINLIKDGYNLKDYKLLSIIDYINKKINLDMIKSEKIWERVKYYD